MKEVNKMKKIVVALGGNAIQAKDNSAAAQQEAVSKTMKVIAQMIENGDQVAITHGNGPQSRQSLATAISRLKQV